MASAYTGREPEPEVEEDPADDLPMTIWEHLRELRTRLIRSLIALIPTSALAWEFKEYLLSFLVAPLTKAWKSLGLGEPTLHFANPIDPFVAYMQIAIVIGFIGASPYIFYQLWMFIAPGLYAREKIYAFPFVFASTLFFAGGAFFGYAVVFPLGFETLLSLGGMLPTGDLRVQPTIMITVPATRYRTLSPIRAPTSGEGRQIGSERKRSTTPLVRSVLTAMPEYTVVNRTDITRTPGRM